MSISSVVTRGYGSFSNVNFIPTRGYKSGASAPVTIDTHDGFTREDYEKHLERLRKREKALQLARDQKLAQRDMLRDQVRGIEPEQDKITSFEALAEIKPVVAAKFELEQVDNSLVELQHELATIYDELIQYGIYVDKMRRMRQEEETILLLI